ncbi:MAG: phospholipase D family protein, partial [Roseiarcus sp.]
LLGGRSKTIRVITRFNLADFSEGVSDIAALRKLLNVGARVRGVRNLHAKLYLFGDRRAIVTSANLTDAALSRNQEFGMVSQDRQIIADCRAYFDGLWERSGADLTVAQVEEWDNTVTLHWALGGRPNSPTGLNDYGADAGMTEPPLAILPTAFAEASQAFVKFLGRGDNRASLSLSTDNVIERIRCHRVLSYPANKRPTGVRDGAIMFVSRLTKDPNDIRVFGRAIGLKHVPDRDDATKQDVKRREFFFAKWPHYIRVRRAEFLAGSLANGVSLNGLMESLGPNSFLPTQRNAARGEGNTDPRHAYGQQAAVELSIEGFGWLSEHLQAAFDAHGKVPQDTLDKLDWPTIP